MKRLLSRGYQKRYIASIHCYYYTLTNTPFGYTRPVILVYPNEISLQHILSTSHKVNEKITLYNILKFIGRHNCHEILIHESFTYYKLYTFLWFNIIQTQ